MGESNGSRVSFVNDYPAPEPLLAAARFEAKLALETDPFDVKSDLERGCEEILVVDTRPRDAYEACRIPGAISLPHREIRDETTEHLPRDRTLVTYCWGPACNASTKGAARLASLGFRVKEMIGGIEYWREEGFRVEGTLGIDAPLYA